MLAVQSPIQHEKSLRSARRLHVDVVVGQPGSGALHPLCTARTRGGLHIRISGGPTCGRFLDGRPVITMMWCASVPSHSGTGVRRRMVLCDELNTGGAREGHRRWRSVARHGGPGILAPILILTTLRRRTMVISGRGRSTLLHPCTANPFFGFS